MSDPLASAMVEPTGMPLGTGCWVFVGVATGCGTVVSIAAHPLTGIVALPFLLVEAVVLFWLAAAASRFVNSEKPRVRGYAALLSTAAVSGVVLLGLLGAPLWIPACILLLPVVLCVPLFDGARADR